jgi:hypothetical protein
MATIHIARNQQTLGTFGEEEVREGIRSGRFSSEDLVWQVGMETWKPLGEMAPLWGLETPPPTLENSAVSAPLIALEDGNEPAWEEREKIGFFPAIVQTVNAVLMKPTETFLRMKHEGGLANPLIYSVILCTVTGAIATLYQMFSNSSMETLTAQLHQLAPNFPTNELPKMYRFVMLGALIISPALCVVGAFVSAAILHLCLMISGGANRPFETTFRVICYAQGSVALFNLLPYCGGLIALIWASYTIIVGIKEAHGTSIWRSTIAVILPDIVCCFIPALLFGGAFAAYLAKTGGLPH